jgi:hypothetical protein
VDPVVYNMVHEDPGSVDYAAIGGLGDQIRELRESIELPLMNPDLFLRVGIKPPKGVLLYGPPGTGKTLLARAIASNIEANFLKVVASAIVDKYIGESARLIREMFGYARDHQPCIIFMDEVRCSVLSSLIPLPSSPQHPLAPIATQASLGQFFDAEFCCRSRADRPHTGQWVRDAAVIRYPGRWTQLAGGASARAPQRTARFSAR